MSDAQNAPVVIDSIPLACDLSVFTDEERNQHEQHLGSLLSRMLTSRELEKGFALDFTIEELINVGIWIDGDRRCCPFLDVTIHVPPAAQVVTVSLTGRAGVKEMLQQALPTPNRVDLDTIKQIFEEGGTPVYEGDK